SDDENDQSATPDAFEVLNFIAAKRLSAGRLTVIDATNVQAEARKPLIALARQYHCLPVAIVFNLPEKLCQERNQQRPDRQFGPHVVRQQSQQLRRSLSGLMREGFRHVFTLSSITDVDAAVIERQPLWNNLKHEHGPFDIIGDVHGCFDELQTLLTQLGYEIWHDPDIDQFGYLVRHTNGRKAIFLGDLVDRGPNVTGVLRLVMSMVQSSVALCVPGNHDMKLMRKLKGNNVQITHGLAESLAQLEPESAEFKQQIIKFIDSLVSHYVLDNGNLVVAHAGMKEKLQGRGSGKVRDFALYGETTGETDEFGLPRRYNWATEYRGSAMMVYGHTPVLEPQWLNNTINIDTGCVFGGKLTALRYPEKELVSVPAAQVYFQSSKPFLKSEETATQLTVQQQHDDLLDIADVIGKRIITTRLHHNVTIREENTITALEVMSRFAVNPKWLIYLPPTMAPTETSRELGLLEHPAEAFSYYREQGVGKVICEEKHMGSRAVIVICRDENTTQRRFGIVDEGIGICYTRTGRRFFENRELETQLLLRVNQALTTSGVWDELHTNWICLDCELMPWSAKAQELVRHQYAAVGAAARASLSEAVAILEQAAPRQAEIAAMLTRFRNRKQTAEKYVEAYRHYCWPVRSLDDLKIAPFHLLASEGTVHTDKDHIWHMQTLAKICCADTQLLLATPYTIVDVNNTSSVEAGIDWWMELTARGGEGIVVKPFDFIVRGPRTIVQAAIKCRGKEYLRIIYGPEYDAPENLTRLRVRGLSAKRSLALREFALGIEALERFVGAEPLRRVHECVFGVLALESEPVDPRL
ncbi:MAG: polynucleotide kinase-phosphatase, partial [Acidobacteriota bacterium]